MNSTPKLYISFSPSEGEKAGMTGPFSRSKLTKKFDYLDTAPFIPLPFGRGEGRDGADSHLRWFSQFAAALSLFLLVFSASAADTAGWGTDLTNAFQNARSNQHAVLLEFSAPWCPYCRQMESKTFKDQHVADTLKQFERVSVNIDHNASLAAQHGVTGIPAFVLLDSEGDAMAKTSGFMDATAFSQWLTDGMTNLTASAAQRQEFETRSNEVVAALGSADLDARAKGLGMVLDCCERREKIYRSFGLERLQAIAATEPALLLEGLNHPALMARIRSANLLRDRVGQSFNIDPWESADIRRQGVQEWKERLAKESARH